MAMPGVGQILGPRIIAEIEDVRRFHSTSALVAYAGLDACLANKKDEYSLV